ncbi:MAG: ABC transporter substrate-binding protein [Azospirillum sp.]|nr:ABC transporter substrate-binding protein [Azospirillum sp.]
MASQAVAARIELGAAATVADLTVGCLFPMTGRGAIYGRDSVGGIRVALADLAREDQAPRLRIVVDDDHSKTSYALHLADDFIRHDGARVLCGVVSSGVAPAVADLAERRGVIFIGTDHASSRTAIEGFHRGYFRVSNDTYSSMAAGARWLADFQAKSGWGRIAFIGADYEHGHVSWLDLTSNLKRLGVRYQEVAVLWPKLYEPDYSAYIEALRNSRPEIIVSALWGGDFVAFLRQAIPAGLLQGIRLASFDTGGNYDTLVALGDHPPAGLVLSSRHHDNWPPTARNRAFVEAFHALEGRYPTYAAEGAYAGIMAIARTLQALGRDADREAMIAFLEHLHLPLPEDPDGTVSRINPLTHQIVQAQAIGEPVANDDFPPARVMLGNWTVYSGDQLEPPPQVVEQRRAAAAPESEAAR